LAVTGIGTASAADLAARPYTKAPPPMIAIYDWSGFYIGIKVAAVGPQVLGLRHRSAALLWC